MASSDRGTRRGAAAAPLALLGVTAALAGAPVVGLGFLTLSAVASARRRKALKAREVGSHERAFRHQAEFKDREIVGDWASRRASGEHEVRIRRTMTQKGALGTVKQSFVSEKSYNA